MYAVTETFYFAYMYFGTEFSSKYGNWSPLLRGGYVVLLLYYLYAKIGVCGLRIYCMLRFMVMTIGRSGIYYVLALFGFLWGMWHDFSILSRLVRLKRVRNRRKNMLILQGESRNVRNCLKCLYSRPSKVVEIWTSFAKALVSYFTGPISFSNLKCSSFFFLCVQFCE